MTKRYLGNIITQNPTAPAGPYENDAAPGVWSLAEALAYQKAGLWPIPGNAAAFGLFGGGDNGGGQNYIQKIVIPTTGNASDFGDLSQGIRYPYGCASATRGIFANGQGNQQIDYVTIATEGNGADFGDMSTGMYGGGGSSNSTRGLFNGGIGANIIQYITIASTGNSTTFGNMIGSDAYGTGSCASPTRGVNFGRWGSGPGVNLIGYVTIASTGSESDFGDLPYGVVFAGGCSSDTRGIAVGGYSFDGGGGRLNNISYVTIASTGNATDFGDLLAATSRPTGLSSNTRGVVGGGETSSATVNTIQYVTIASTGNATDFGDLVYAINSSGGASNAHGGLQ